MAPQNPIAELLPWAPLWLIGLGLIVLAVTAALAAHSTLYALLGRLFRARLMLHAALLRSRAVTRYAFVVFAASLVLPLAPLEPTFAAAANRVLIAAIIVLVGWAVITTVNMAFDRYANRFRLDVADNLSARKAVTQVRVLKRTVAITLIVLTAAFALMTFEPVRELGMSLFASAGIAGIAAGLAARPVLGNLIAGIQIAISQPIRLDDVLVVNGEWGTVEEITSTYVVLKLWDWRR
jgi:small-conductance mechanosensitive channel